jgi:hypothetical protein
MWRPLPKTCIASPAVVVTALSRPPLAAPHRTGNDFDVRNTTFSSSFEQVQYLHEQRSKEYLLAMRVKEGSAAAGKDIHENGLEGINGMYIVGIDRPSTGDRLRDVPRTFVLQVWAPLATSSMIAHA